MDCFRGVTIYIAGIVIVWQTPVLHCPSGHVHAFTGLVWRYLSCLILFFMMFLPRTICLPISFSICLAFFVFIKLTTSL